MAGKFYYKSSAEIGVRITHGAQRLPLQLALLAFPIALSNIRNHNSLTIDVQISRYVTIQLMHLSPHRIITCTLSDFLCIHLHLLLLERLNYLADGVVLIRAVEQVQETELPVVSGRLQVVNVVVYAVEPEPVQTEP